MKHIIIILFACIVASINLHSQFIGAGTETEPYQIHTKVDMERLADSVNNKNNWSEGKFFKLMQNIDEPVTSVIGLQSINIYTSTKHFKGVFDGNNLKIVASIIKPTETNIGIFGSVDSSAIIKNLNVYGKIEGNTNVGGIIGLNAGIIEKCNNYASIKSERGLAGGIVGWSICSYRGNRVGGRVIDCKNYADIYNGNDNRATYVAGIVGRNDYYVSHCLNAGNIYAFSFVGGIVGDNNNGRVLYSTNIGTVVGFGAGTFCSEYATTGGIVGGAAMDSSYIGYCVNSGLVIGNIGVGGICGTTTNPYSDAPLYGIEHILVNCINTGVVINLLDDNKVGAIVGFAAKTIITNCFYDKQMCIYSGIGNAKDELGVKGLLTKELIGYNLESILGTDWIYNDKLYPMLKGLENEIISKIAAAPTYFAPTHPDYDQHNNLRECFYVNIENAVQWERADNKISYSDAGKVYLENTGDDTMYAYIDDINVKKTIPIRVNKLCPKSQDIEIDTVIYSLHKRVYRCDIDTTVGGLVILIGPPWACEIYTIELSALGGIEGPDKDLFSYVTSPILPAFFVNEGYLVVTAFFNHIDATPGLKTAYFYLFEDFSSTLIGDRKKVLKFELSVEVIEGVVAVPDILDFGTINQNQTYTKNITLENNDTQPALIKYGYLAKGTDFKLETDLDNVTMLSMGSLIANISVNTDKSGEITDTLIVIVEYETCEDILKIIIKARVNVKLENVKFTISAACSTNVSPTRKNFRIPIYIESNAEITAADSLYIDRLVITINKNIFFPKSVTNGSIYAIMYNDDTMNIRVENILVPPMQVGEEKVLFYLVGDVLLGNTDSSAVNIIEPIISFTDKEPDLIDGCLTTSICEDRFITFFDKPSGVFVLDGPVVTDNLTVKCVCYERGSYHLEIFDIMGYSDASIKQWNVDPMLQTEFIFDDIPVRYFWGRGILYVVMHGPHKKYYDKFIITKN